MAALAVLGAIGCRAAVTEPQAESVQHQVDVDSTVVLKPGEIAALRGTDISILFRGVAQDSRCPVDVECVWQGDAHVQLAARRGGGDWTAVDLHTGVDPKAAVFAGHLITLVDVAPVRRSDDVVRSADYSVTLKITRS